MRDHEPKPEFARAVGVADLGPEGLALRIAAEPAERAALARRFDLVALDRLEATVRITRAGVHAVRLAARFSADVVQSCVVTLEPVASRIEESIELVFAPGGEAAGPEVVVDPLAADPPEPLADGVIDVGEVVAQHLALALDPYPRAPGARLEDVLADRGRDGGAAAETSPFAALARLRGHS